MGKGIPVTFEGVRCEKATDKAILVELDGDEVWLPRSQIEEDSEVCDEGDEGTLVITEWIAREKGLI